MARGVHKLTARAVVAAKTPGLYADGGGLFLQVSNRKGHGKVKAGYFPRSAVLGEHVETGVETASKPIVETG